MRVTREDKSPTRIIIKVAAEAADLEPIHQHVLSHFKNVKVPGFRAGKAPANLVEQNISQQQILDEFMEHALNELYRRAVDQEQVRPISTPNVKLKKFVPYSQMEFEAETEILGPIKLPNYKIIKLSKKKPEVTVKDVDEVIKSLQGRLAERTDVERPAKEGDELIIDFAGRDAAHMPVSGVDGTDYPLVLGSKAFIPGFEENLQSVKAGEIKEFEVSFPKDYGVAALQNKPVTFKVDVKKVSELKELKANDELAKKAGPFQTLKDLKADIKKQLLNEKQNQANNEYQNELMRKIAAKTEIEVPESLAQEENLRLEAQEKQNLAYRGQTWQEHLDSEGINEQEHRQRHYPEALERVKIGLILSEIASKENIQITPKELELRLQILKGQHQDPQMQAELSKESNQRDIEARLMTEKTLAKLTNYASS
ncbi:trigger factor [Candidatus Saccharibacteria bacterium]|nr:trigger factor [Candidatus Saccharibacteria bacterium]